MKIDTVTLKKQVILHLPYLLFLLVFAKLARRYGWLQERMLRKNCWV